MRWLRNVYLVISITSVVAVIPLGEWINRPGNQTTDAQRMACMVGHLAITWITAFLGWRESGKIMDGPRKASAQPLQATNQSPYVCTLCWDAYPGRNWFAPCEHAAKEPEPPKAPERLSRTAALRAWDGTDAGLQAFLDGCAEGLYGPWEKRQKIQEVKLFVENGEWKARFDACPGRMEFQEKLELLKVGPQDSVVLRTPEHLSKAQSQQIEKEWKRAMGPDRKLTIIEGFDFEVKKDHVVLESRSHLHDRLPVTLNGPWSVLRRGKWRFLNIGDVFWIEARPWKLTSVFVTTGGSYHCRFNGLDREAVRTAAQYDYQTFDLGTLVPWEEPATNALTEEPDSARGTERPWEVKRP